MRLMLLMGLAVSFISIRSLAQDTPSLEKVSVEKYLNSVSEKSARVDAKIEEQTEKYLNKLEKQEQRLYRKLSKVDSIAAKNIFADSRKRYDEIRQQIRNHSPKLLRNNGEYLSWVDTSVTSVKFLESLNISQKLPISPPEFKNAINKIHELQDQLKQAENIKEFIRQRKQYLTNHLQQFNLEKDLQKLNKQAYYYSQQINEYKTILNDPEKIEAKLIPLLRKIPAFEKFIQQNGMLAGLFNVPRDYTTSSLTGLQTINQVSGMLQDRMSFLGPNASQNMQQNLASAQAALSQVRNRLAQGGNTS